MKSLDYDASVPINPRAPFSVTIDPKKPPGDQRNRDFIPSKDSIDLGPSSVVVRKDFIQKPKVRYKEDYISGADMEVRNHNAKNHIIRLAKELYAKQQKRRDDLKAAEVLIAKATEKDKEKPSPELDRALRIVARSKPMTKEQAIEIATEQYYAHNS